MAVADYGKARKLIYPAGGVLEDVETLLDKFSKCDSLRFNDFSAVWRGMDFSAIHYGRKDMREKREFVEETFKVVLKFALYPYAFQIRVGAIYMLFGIYTTQLTTPKVRIRIVPRDWYDLMNLHEELKQTGHVDADFILRKLKDQFLAFSVVAAVNSYCREDRYAAEDGESESSNSDEEQEKQTKSKTDPIHAVHMEPLSSVLEENCLSALTEVHKLYMNCKKEFLGKENPECGMSANVLKTQLDMVNEDVAKKILALSGSKSLSSKLAKVTTGQNFMAKHFSNLSAEGMREIVENQHAASLQEIPDIYAVDQQPAATSSLDLNQPTVFNFPKSKSRKRGKKVDGRSNVRKLKEKALLQPVTKTGVLKHIATKEPQMLVTNLDDILCADDDDSSDEDDWVPKGKKKKNSYYNKKLKKLISSQSGDSTQNSQAPRSSRPSRAAKSTAKVMMQHGGFNDDDDSDDTYINYSRFGSMMNNRKKTTRK